MHLAGIFVATSDVAPVREWLHARPARASGSRPNCHLKKCQLNRVKIRSRKQWFLSGFERVRTIPQVWALLAITLAVQTLVSFLQVERWISQGWKSFEVSSYPHLSSWTAELRFLGTRILWGGAK